MKIAMIGHKVVPSREGGVEIVVEELSNRLVEMGHQVDIYNRKRKHQYSRMYNGAKIITIPTINKKGLDAFIYSFLVSIRTSLKKYDVLHYHAEGSCAMLWIPHLFKKRIIVTIHGLDWKRSKWGSFATKYIKFGEKLVAKYADEIIVLSEQMQRYFKETYNRNTYFIPNGINKPTIRQAKIINKKYGLEKNSFILFLARIVPEKGLEYLIDAYVQIKTNIKLVIAGDSSHTDEFMKKIKEKARKDNRIIMTGFVQGEELEELYSNCFLYCLPSDVEGMPISLLEAISYGKRCLVSNIEENVQLIEESNSKTFKKGNVEDLKNKLQEMLQNESNDISVDSEFFRIHNWDNIAKNIEIVYNGDGGNNVRKYSNEGDNNE